MRKNKLLIIAAGLCSGLLNGLFGSGGGVIAVLFLRKLTDDERAAHATATLMMLIMSAVSLLLYAIDGSVDLKEGLKFLPGGLAGAVIGALWLKNIDVKLLRRVFGGVVAASGAVMLLR